MTGHPRTCGAALTTRKVIPLAIGSSPYLRGSRVKSLHGGIPKRVIPVPAGQPTTTTGAGAGCWGHPRTCGAAGTVETYKAVDDGSSPYLRGSPYHPQSDTAGYRVIPVPAGQPCQVLTWWNP